MYINCIEHNKITKKNINRSCFVKLTYNVLNGMFTNQSYSNKLCMTINWILLNLVNYVNTYIIIII